MTPPRILAVGEEFPPMDPAPPANGHRPETPKGKPGATPRATAGERFAVLNALVDSGLAGLAGLTRAEIAVWIVLYRDTRDGIARTSYDDLAFRGGLDRRSVGRALRSLEARGLVEPIRRGGLGRGPSSYAVRPPPKGG